VFSHLLEVGDGSILEGVYEGIESGWFTGEIAESAYRLAREVDAGRRIVVGVNAFTEGEGSRVVERLRVDPSVEEHQLRRLAALRAERDGAAVAAALAEVGAAAADPTRNLMPPLIAAVGAHATVGELTGALRAVFGGYVERVVV
jgi:methylmalonyl-CoA mutase, N-terminal domain